MAHTIVLAGAALRCRGCSQFYAPSEFVFGQEIRDRFAESPDAMTHLWYHLPCAAQLRPNIVRATLATYPGPLPERQLVIAILEKQAVAPMLAQRSKEHDAPVHPTLAAALSRFSPSSHPSRLHLGGPPPSLSSKRHPHSLWIPAGAARVAAWCALQVGRLGASPGDSEKLRLLEQCLVEPDDPKLHPKPKQGLHHNPFAQALAKVTQQSPATAVSFSALEGLARFDDGHASSVRRLMSQAATQCVVTVSPGKSTPDATGCATDAALFIATTAPQLATSFLEGLDDALLAQEAQAAFDERAPGHRTVRRVFWRHQGQVLVEFAGGGFGLLVKLKARWRFFEGERDDVLANVPDELFADAAAGVFVD